MIIGISGKMGSGKDTVGKIIQLLTIWEGDKNFYQSESFKTRYESELDFVLENLDAPPRFLNSVFRNKKYADKLKGIVCMLIGCTREQLEERDFKESELGEEWWYYYDEQTGRLFSYIGALEANKKLELIKLTPRKMLQLLGTEAGREIIHPNIWVNALFSDYKTDLGSWSYKRCDGVWVNYVSERTAKSFSEYKFVPYVPKWVVTDMRFPNESEAIESRGGITIRVNRSETDGNSGNHASETALDNSKFKYTITNDGSIEDLVKKVKQILIKEEII